MGMTTALKVYEAFRDDEEKARVLSEAFAALEERIPSNIATREDVEHAAALVRSELKLDFTTQLSERTMELRAEIERVRLETERMRSEIKTTETRLLRWNVVFWTTQLTAFAGLCLIVLRATKAL